MHVTFVQPAVGKKPGQPYVRSWKMEPLTLAVLKALTPPDVETDLVDDRLEVADYDRPSDLVAITVEAYTARRAYAMADAFRKRGRKVVLGGYHVTLNPEEAAQHADAVVVGNAEDVWTRVVEDARKGRLQKVYRGGLGTFRPGLLPDRSLFRGRSYLPLRLVEVGRGCPFHCDFCAITAYYQGRCHHRPIRDVVRDIEQSGGRYFFLVDDNIAGNLPYLEKLVDALMPLKVYWVSQASLTVARHPRLLEKMRKSGCQMLLIGFESLDSRNLASMGKEWMERLGDRDELVRRIHEAGIHIYATFVFGYDHDTPESFERALEFALKHDFFFAAFNHLLPLPGTPVYRRLEREGRLIRPRWWLEPGYRYGEIVFQPKHFSPEELSVRARDARRAFFRTRSILRRSLSLLGRKPTLPMVYTFFSQNLTLQREVEAKFGLPLGENLDAWPK